MEKAKLVSLPKIADKRGNLSVVESDNHIPFTIRRTYLIYDVPGGQVRGGHAFIEQKEMIVALSGSLDIIVFDGVKEQKFSLNRSHQGLLNWVNLFVWHQWKNGRTDELYREWFGYAAPSMAFPGTHGY